MKVYIYHLLNEDDQVRYVGQTMDPAKRFYQHLSQELNTHCSRWIGKMLRAGLEPTMRIHATVDSVDADKAEADEIARQVSLGAILTNIRNGLLQSVDHCLRKRTKKRRKRIRVRRVPSSSLRARPEDPPEVKQARELLATIRKRVFSKLPPLSCDPLPEHDSDYLTLAFVRRNEAVLRKWIQSAKIAKKMRRSNFGKSRYRVSSDVFSRKDIRNAIRVLAGNNKTQVL